MYLSILFLALISLRIEAISSAVTYDFSGGRFGDCLVSYCHAKWISYKYNIPLLYKPFTYSDQLVMHQSEMHYSQNLADQFSQIVTVTKNHHHFDPHAGILYVIPFFPESIFNRHDEMYPYLFSTDWHDADFKSELQKMICPNSSLALPYVPQEMLTVAVHIRKGTGWDIPIYKITPEELTASHPLRFAPDSFYISQLKRITTLFSDQIIYVYLFTDHDNPAELAEKYSEALQSDHMIIDYRKTENNEFVNVLDDFFALTRFDCLIRADSNFSYIASKLGNYKIIISPWHGIVNEEKTVINEVNLEINELSFIVKELW